MTQLRLFVHGIALLNDEELLTLILNNKDAANHLLKHYSDIQDLAIREAQELSMIKGLGKCKARMLHAIFELSRRLQTPLIDDAAR